MQPRRTTLAKSPGTGEARPCSSNRSMNHNAMARESSVLCGTTRNRRNRVVGAVRTNRHSRPPPAVYPAELPLFIFMVVLNLIIIAGHELGHIRLHHVSLWYQLAVAYSQVIPLLGPGLSRLREYSCDRHGAFLSPGGARGLVLLASGRYTETEVDLEELVRQGRMSRRRLGRPGPGSEIAPIHGPPPGTAVSHRPVHRRCANRPDACLRPEAFSPPSWPRRAGSIRWALDRSGGRRLHPQLLSDGPLDLGHRAGSPSTSAALSRSARPAFTDNPRQPNSTRARRPGSIEHRRSHHFAPHPDRERRSSQRRS